MEDNFYQDEFERFIKEQADNHRMYPSDGVWRNIHKQIHGDKNWPALTVAAFLLLITTIGISVYFSPQQNIFASTPSTENATRDIAKSRGTQTISTPVALSDQSSLTNQKAGWKIDKNEVIATDDVAKLSSKVDVNILATPGAVSTTATVEKMSMSSAPIIAKTKTSEELTPAGKGNVEMPHSLSALVSLDHNPNLLAETVNFNFSKNAPALKLKPAISSPTVKKRAAWKNKFSYQFYITPSASYRRLREEKSENNETTEGPVALNLIADVQQIVRHKPGNGLEAGFGLMYNLTPKLKIKTGLQLNMRQYNIEAYKSITEVATITLQRNNGIDTISSFAVYRTNTGYQSAEITNRYFQVSIPVGLDLQIMGNNFMQLNVGASIQPTYQVNRNAFILSSNFKNYTENPDMLRAFNVNSSLEAYLSFKSGSYHWQIGPQVRYQHLSTMIPQYSIKEHLLDYGLKLGVTKPLQ